MTTSNAGGAGGAGGLASGTAAVTGTHGQVVITPLLATAVPTLGQWGLALLATVAALLAGRRLRRVAP